MGTQLTCPGCNATITVPEETAAATVVSISAGDPPTLRGYLATTAQRTSRLAIASLVCSRLSFVTCIGWLPGIICGHMAKSRIRRNPALTGDVIQSSTYIKGYGLKLQFDQAINRTMAGRIYLCSPGEAKSYVAGAFKVRLPSQK